MATEPATSTSRPDLAGSASAELAASGGLSVGRTSLSVPASASAFAGIGALTPKWLGKRVGRFRLIGLIGRGAMGKVFRAEDVQLHRLVALKVISSRSTRKKTASEKLELLLREARSAAKLEHPNIVSVHEVSSAGDIHFIAMELVEGGNLKDLVIAAGPLDVARASQLCADAAEGLQHAHEQGVIHRDVKPANLMLTRAGRCKLCDFGLARVDDPSELSEEISGAVGTPQFVAPEVAQAGEATALSDIYSLAATLFYLLTGSPPFSGENAKEVIRKHVHDMPPDVRTLRPDVPEGLALAIWRAMAKQPTARYESAGHFARVLRLHAITIETPPGTDEYATAGRPAVSKWPLVDRRRLMIGALLGGGLLVVLTCTLIALAMRGGGTRPNSGKEVAPGTSGPAASAPATEPPSVTALPKPGQVLPATDTASLLRVALETDPMRHDGTVAVEGRVVRIELRRPENLYRIDLRGVDRKRGLNCTFAPEMLAALAQRVGGDPGVKLAGKRVKITGTVDVSDGQPLIEIRSAQQVTPLE